MSRLSLSRRLSFALLLLALTIGAAPLCHATDSRSAEVWSPFRWLHQLVAWVLASGGSMDPNGYPAAGAQFGTHGGDTTEGGGAFDPNG